MNSLEQFIGKGEQLTFSDFRLFVLNRYKNEFDKCLEAKELIADVDYEGSNKYIQELVLVYQDAIDEIDIFTPGYDEYKDFLDWLDEFAMEDYFLNVGMRD